MHIKRWKVQGSGRNKIVTIEYGFKRKHKSPAKVKRDAERKRMYLMRKHKSVNSVNSKKNFVEPSTSPSGPISCNLESDHETKMSLENGMRNISALPNCKQGATGPSNNEKSIGEQVKPVAFPETWKIFDFAKHLGIQSIINCAQRFMEWIGVIR